MKFTEEEQEFIVVTHQIGACNITEIAKKLCEKFDTRPYSDSVRRSVSSFLQRRKLTKNTPRIEDNQEFIDATSKKLSKSTYYIITQEQNETPLHKEFWNNILAYKEYLGAELSVILGRYKNPTSVFTDVKHENWNKETKPYWDAGRHDIHKYLSILSDVKISYTNQYPLNRLSGLAQGKSIIVGHPRLHMRTEPTLNGYQKKMLFTTGSVTVPNYTDSGLGAISAGSHKYGFVIVEIRNKEVFHVRQVEATKDGNFIDLCHEVKDGKVTVIEDALGMVCGDTHHYELDTKIDKQNDKIVKSFNIPQVVQHDIVDGESCNNHKTKSAIQQYIRYNNNQHLIMEELHSLKEWIETKPYKVIIPQANHNDRFDRVLDEDWRKDIQNGLFYMEYITKAMKGELSKGVLASFLEHHIPDRVKCLSYQDSFKIGRYECSQHGNYGANGAKGSPTSFRKLDIPIILAHSHVPFRADDCLYVGTNTKLILDYNQKGSTSWVQANVLIGKNGVAQHIIFINGEYTTFKKLN